MCGGTQEEFGNDLMSNQVEIQMIKEQIEARFKFKILILGAGESGKSTVAKQLKLIHHQKPSPQELKLTATSLHQNVIDCLRSLLGAVKTLEPSCGEFSEEEEALVQAVTDFEDGSLFNASEATTYENLWFSKPMQEAWNRRREFWILDSWTYYVKHIHRFAQPNFEPTQEDSVMARIRTTGVVAQELEHKIVPNHPDELGKLVFQVIDVGGQRNERKKWLYQFDDVNAIIFLANLGGYDQVLFEDGEKNRLEESITLYQDMANKPIFKDTPFFLFLNKKDVFEEMLREKGLHDAGYTEYKGDADNLQDSLDFVQTLFKKEIPNKNVDVQYISARWKRDVKTAFEVVKDALYTSQRSLILEDVAKLKDRINILEKLNAKMKK